MSRLADIEQRMNRTETWIITSAGRRQELKDEIRNERRHARESAALSTEDEHRAALLGGAVSGRVKCGEPRTFKDLYGEGDEAVNDAIAELNERARIEADGFDARVVEFHACGEGVDEHWLAYTIKKTMNALMHGADMGVCRWRDATWAG